MKKFLFVCSGNTCRSPMAEGIFNYLAKNNALMASAFSAGLFAQDNFHPSYNSIKVMQQLNIDISNHRSRKLTENIAADADIILVMTKSGVNVDILNQFADKVSTLGEYAGENIDVIDPFAGAIVDYINCRDVIHRLIENIINKELGSSHDD